jgi:hypothetical protein
MAFVVGDATHLKGKPIVGTPLSGQVYRCNGVGFEPVDAAEAETVNEIGAASASGLALAGQALDLASSAQGLARFASGEASGAWTTAVVASGKADYASGRIALVDGRSGLTISNGSGFSVFWGTPASGYTLQCSGANLMTDLFWGPGGSGGGGVLYAWGFIDVDGQTTLDAGSFADTLRFSAGPGIMLSGVRGTESGVDEIFIEVSGAPDIEVNRRNIQLLFMQQSKIGNMVAGNMVDGFYDTFQDDAGVDGRLSAAHYNNVQEFYSAIQAASGLNTAVDPSSTQDMNLLDVKGPTVRWRRDNGAKGHFEGMEEGFSLVPVIDEGSGKVGFPAENHGLTAGLKVRFYGFSGAQYNAVHTVDSLTSSNRIVASVAYSAETMGSACKRRSVLTLGSGSQCPDIEPGDIVGFAADSARILWIDPATTGAGLEKVQLSSSHVSDDLTGIYSAWFDPSVPGILTVTSTVVPDGGLNLSTVDCTPAQSGSTYVTASSESSTLQARKAFDHVLEVNNGWSNNNSGYPSWIKYDFGSGNSRVVNKWRFKNWQQANETNLCIKRFRLQASNDNTNFMDLDSTYANTDFPIISIGQWSNWFTFTNSTAYRYYRLYITSGYYPNYACAQEIELVDATVVPGVLTVGETTDVSQADCRVWDHISGATVSASTPGNSRIWHSVSFDGRTIWKVFKNSAWREIAREQSGQWQYADALDQWQAASGNNSLSALKKAMATSANQMSSSELAAITPQQWESTGGWDQSCLTMDFAFGMQADGLNLPSLDKWTVVYSVPDADIDLVSQPYETGVNVSRANGAILIRNIDSSTRVLFSVQDPPVWMEAQELTAAAGLADGVEQYNTGDAPVSGGNMLRIRVVGDHSCGTEIHGWSVNWGV